MRELPNLGKGVTSETMEILSHLAETGYAPRRVPGERDQEIGELVSQVRTAEQFSRFAEGLNLVTARILLAFAARTASYAVRIQDPAWIRHGLMAAQLALTQEDAREILVIYSILYRGLELLGADPVATFVEVAGWATSDIRDFTIKFTQRDPQDKSIAAMGYVEGSDEDGFDFVRTW